MKGPKAEASNLNIGFDRLGIQGWWNKKSRNFKGMAQKFNLLCVCCINPIAHFDEPWF
jgi:hypothetical protein